ncbi:MAG TPA: glycosyltransferase [Candidatus Binatia bacterium]|nr:glycosyltransferase [Candidatus Binatia bacterium]
MPDRSPQLSVVIATPDGFETIRKTVHHLRVQTVSDRLELVIVAPSAERLELDPGELSAFCQARVVDVGPTQSIARAHAAGIRRATAPVVVLAEDHSFPEAGWAEALIRRHVEQWAVVGPVVRNANPDRLLSWADFLLGYGAWMDPAPAGEVDYLPGHNSSYKRAVLLALDDELEVALEAEFHLHEALRARGHRLYLEPAARTAHVNFGRFSPWVPYLVHAGRVFAAARARQWSWRRRLIYVGGAPLIPLVRLLRVRDEIRRPGRPAHLWPRVAPALIVGLCLDTLGQLLGYACGAGRAGEKLYDFEFHRDRHGGRRRAG